MYKEQETQLLLFSGELSGSCAVASYNAQSIDSAPQPSFLDDLLEKILKAFEATRGILYRIASWAKSAFRKIFAPTTDDKSLPKREEGTDTQKSATMSIMLDAIKLLACVVVVVLLVAP